jgi:hypothetical protein
MTRRKLSETTAALLSLSLVMAIGAAVFGGAYLLSKHGSPSQVADTAGPSMPQPEETRPPQTPSR